MTPTPVCFSNHIHKYNLNSKKSSEKVTTYPIPFTHQWIEAFTEVNNLFKVTNDTLTE